MANADFNGYPSRTETAVRDAVLANASQNAALLVQLGVTEDAPEELALHQKRMDHLRVELDEQRQALEVLKDQVEAKFRVHRKYSDSTTRRLVYRASFMLDKLEMKKAVGEKEYFKILGEQNRAETREAALNHELAGAEAAEATLQTKARLHGKTHERIDTLYEALFAGPTPGFPQEDNFEGQYYAAKATHEVIRERILSARKAAKSLNQALRSCTQADALLDTAAFETRNSFFILDGAAQCLDHSNEYISYAESSILAASDVLQVRESQSFSSAKGMALKTVASAKTQAHPADSKAAYLTHIRMCKKQLDATRQAIKALVNLCGEQERAGLLEIKTTARILEDSRQTLHQSRLAIFEEVAGFGRAAPSYHMCCDRTESFCELPPPPQSDGDDDDRPLDAALPTFEEATGLENGSEEDRSAANLVGDHHRLGGQVIFDQNAIASLTNTEGAIANQLANSRDAQERAANHTLTEHRHHEEKGAEHHDLGRQQIRHM